MTEPRKEPPKTKRVTKLAVPLNDEPPPAPAQPYLDDESFDEDGNVIGNAAQWQADRDAEGEWP